MIQRSVVVVMKCFPRSFINQHGELIVHREANEYFNIAKCADELEIKCKVLEWLSRPASKGEPFRTKKKNEEFTKFMMDGINNYLGTEFTRDQMKLIYQELGNQVNRTLTIKFIESNYKLSILKENL
jgi:hypothetical protein